MQGLAGYDAWKCNAPEQRMPSGDVETTLTFDDRYLVVTVAVEDGTVSEIVEIDFDGDPDDGQPCALPINLRAAIKADAKVMRRLDDDAYECLCDAAEQDGDL